MLFFFQNTLINDSVVRNIRVNDVVEIISNLLSGLPKSQFFSSSPPSCKQQTENVCAECKAILMPL